MNILGKLRSSFFRCSGKRQDEGDDKPCAPVARPGELFEATGWGPVEQFESGGRRPYAGPSFPDCVGRLPRPSGTSIRAVNDARHFWSMRDFDKAIRAYEEANEADAGNPDILFEEAQILWSHGNIAEARLKLEEAVKVDPKNTRSLVSLCRMADQYGSQPHEGCPDEILAQCIVSTRGHFTPTLRALAAEMRGDIP